MRPASNKRPTRWNTKPSENGFTSCLDSRMNVWVMDDGAPSLLFTPSSIINPPQIAFLTSYLDLCSTHKKLSSNANEWTECPLWSSAREVLFQPRNRISPQGFRNPRLKLASSLQNLFSKWIVNHVLSHPRLSFYSFTFSFSPLKYSFN